MISLRLPYTLRPPVLAPALPAAIKKTKPLPLRPWRAASRTWSAHARWAWLSCAEYCSASLTQALSASGVFCDKTRARADIRACTTSAAGTAVGVISCWRACMSAMRSLVRGWLRK
jgi:hypothetical protein